MKYTLGGIAKNKQIQIAHQTHVKMFPPRHCAQIAIAMKRRGSNTIILLWQTAQTNNLIKK